MKIVIGILILSAVIFFHEFGHFLAARANRITVKEFALGMGPRILHFQRGDTTYSWRLLPFGGFCSFLTDEDEEDEEDLRDPGQYADRYGSPGSQEKRTPKEGSFNAAPLWRRAVVIAAGPFFNILLAFIVAVIVISFSGADPARVVEVPSGSPAAQAGLLPGDIVVSYEGGGVANGRELYTDIYMDEIPLDRVDLTVERNGATLPVSYQPEAVTRWMLGYYYDTADDRIEITDLVRGYPMEAAGLVAGDIILAVDGYSVKNQNELNTYWEEHPMDGSPVTVTYLHKGIERTATVTPLEDTSASLGFSFNMAREKMGPADTLKYSFGEIKYWLSTTVKSLGKLITGQYSVNDLSGPVGIVSAIGDVYDEAASEGALELVMTMLNMVILISANLGVMNLLPIPALDGGRLVFLLIEAIRRKPVNKRVEGAINFALLIALMALMFYVTFHDISKLF